MCIAANVAANAPVTGIPLAGTAARLQRSSGTVRLSFKRRGPKTVLDELHQQGCYKARFPTPTGQRISEAVLINTSGGLTDGDELSCVAAWHDDAAALITTQAAERIYRSRHESAVVRSNLTIGERATACWLPQETILFDGGRLDRATDVAMARDSRLFAAESIVFGRTAMGEVTTSGRVFDRWRIRMDGRLAFADSLLFDGGGDSKLTEQLAREAVAGNSIAMATVLYVSADCGRYMDDVRRALDESDVVAGATDLGPLIVARMLAEDYRSLRDAVSQVFAVTQGDGGFELPRVWNC
jgi:urease accessory protein